MNTAPTPEDFLNQPDVDEDDSPGLTALSGDIWQLPSDPLEKIAQGVDRLVEYFTSSQGQTFTAELVADGHNPEACPVEQECADLEAKLSVAYDVINQIDRALGKSTAKPSLAAKAVIEAWRNPSVEEVPEDSASPELAEEYTADSGAVDDVPPASVAPVEEWRAYARRLGFAGPDIDKANRSVIRTTLGIAHVETQPAADGGA